MRQKDAVDLGYEMNAALGAYLDSFALTEDDRLKARDELLQLFWDNKSGIIAYLLGGPTQILGSMNMIDWKPIDDDARDGREVLLRRDNGRIYAGYYGLAPMAHGVGASTLYPWTIIDNTNGVNHLMDGGLHGMTHYADIASLPQDQGQK